MAARIGKVYVIKVLIYYEGRVFIGVHLPLAAYVGGAAIAPDGHWHCVADSASPAARRLQVA
jgi:hypothetical protein